MGNKLRNGNLAATTICFLFVLQWTVNPRVASSSLATGAPLEPLFYDGGFLVIAHSQPNHI